MTFNMHNNCQWRFHMLFALTVSGIFDTFKPITVERLIVHTFSYFGGSSLYFSPTHLCVAVTVCKQMTSVIPAVTCTRSTIMIYLHGTPLIWVINLG